MAILGPHLSATIVFALSSHMLSEVNDRAHKAIDEANDFKYLDMLHHYTSGVKAFTTEYQYYSMDEMRQACGGAG